MDRTNIVLIGMPSSGKTTIGQPLAQKTGKQFIDTDLVIKERENKPLREIVNQDGLKRFIEIQEEVLLGLHVENHVISTGGSVIYGDASMMHLKSDGLVIYLKNSLSELETRIAPDRRFARNEGQSFSDLYYERAPLYEKYADKVIECDGKTEEEIVEEILRVLN